MLKNWFYVIKNVTEDEVDLDPLSAIELVYSGSAFRFGGVDADIFGKPLLKVCDSVMTGEYFIAVKPNKLYRVKDLKSVKLILKYYITIKDLEDISIIDSFINL